MNVYNYEDIKIGHKEQFSVKITQNMQNYFSEITGDINPLHIDESFANQKNFDRCVCFGMLTASFLSTLAGVYLPGQNSLIHSVEVKMLKPVFVDDSITVKGEIVEKNDLFKLLIIKISIINQDGVKVMKGKMNVGVLDE